MWPWQWDWSKLDGPTISIIFATLIGPILAVQAQKWVERLGARRNRRDQVFRTLMATRATRLSPEHVQALNMIDFEFQLRSIEWFGAKAKIKSVQTAWNEYRDHLNTQHTPETVDAWLKENDDFFVEMLYKMSVAVGYPFEKLQIRKSVYAPTAHSNLEDDQTIIRRGLVELFSKKFAIPVITFPPPQTPEQIEEAKQKAATEAAQAAREAEEQSVLRKALTDQAKGEPIYKVQIVNGDDVATKQE